MKYTSEPHTNIDDNRIMLRNYSKLLSFESNKTFAHVKFEKTLLDSKITPFAYFTSETTSLYNPYILSEGDIFTPINNKNYYYIIRDNQPSKIPDIQTLEVLLNQRNSSIEDIKLLEDSEFVDVLLYSNGSLQTPNQMVLPLGIKINAETQKKLAAAAGGGGGGGGGSTPEIQSKVDEWTPDMKLTSIAEEFAALAATASSAEALLNSSIDQMQGVVDMAVADAEASQAQAKASQAQAEAAIAQANAAQAEAEAQKAEYESKNTE